jgi:DNA-binding CsgD family transcriptional regulator
MTRRPKEPAPLPDPRAVDPLTDREIQVLALVAAGERTQAISRRLGIAENTVKAHLTNVYRKTGSRNRVQAARYYLEHYAGQPGEPPPTATATSQLPAGVEPSPLIQRQIEELQARLEQLAPAASEVKRLQHALNALRAIDPN